MSRSCCALLVVCASSSAKYGTRVCVTVSRMTIGALAVSDAPMFVDGAIFDFARLRPGTYVMICAPGENPSPLFCAAVLTRTPLSFGGATLRTTLSFRPVVVLACTVNASFGHGSKQ